ncbi:MAG: hypothetical protein U0Z17_04620 [Bacteroidales bacterium]
MFSTSKDVATAKAEALKDATATKAAKYRMPRQPEAGELKDKAAQGVETAKEYTKDVVEKIEEVADNLKTAAKEVTEKAKDFGENLKEKAEETIEKLDEKSCRPCRQLEGKIRSAAEPTETPVLNPVEEVITKTVADKTAEVSEEPVAEASKTVEEPPKAAPAS